MPVIYSYTMLPLILWSKYRSDETKMDPPSVSYDSVDTAYSFVDETRTSLCLPLMLILWKLDTHPIQLLYCN